MTEYVGHPTTRRTETADGWLYEDETNQTLAIYLLLQSCSLPDLDAFIERLEADGVASGQELRERRGNAYKAFCSGNHDAVARHIEWIINRKRFIEIAEAADEPARRGCKVIKGAAYGHELVHGTPEEKTARWEKYRNDCVDVFRKHPNWGLDVIRQEVAEMNGVSLKTIQRQTADLKELLSNAK